MSELNAAPISQNLEKGTSNNQLPKSNHLKISWIWNVVHGAL